MAKIIQLILADEKVGRGVEGDPIRRVTQLWTLDGVLIASCDPFAKAADGESMSFFDPGRAAELK